MSARPPVVLAVVALLWAACIANPTPHPESAGGTTSPGVDAGTLADSADLGDDGRGLCGALGGSWDDDASACLFVADDAGFMGEAPTSGGNDADGLFNAVGPHVVGVAVTGDPGAYTFAVTVASTETGCDAYADWWEVVAADGTLAYRRVLAHPHVDEQPFTRDGGPIDLTADELVVVRAHMSTGGYGEVMIGAAGQGFVPARLDTWFAADLEAAEPRPTPCAP